MSEFPWDKILLPCKIHVCGLICPSKKKEGWMSQKDVYLRLCISQPKNLIDLPLPQCTCAAIKCHKRLIAQEAIVAHILFSCVSKSCYSSMFWQRIFADWLNGWWCGVATFNSSSESKSALGLKVAVYTSRHCTSGFSLFRWGPGGGGGRQTGGSSTFSDLWTSLHTTTTHSHSLSVCQQTPWASPISSCTMLAR